MKYSVAIVAALAAFTNAQSACEASAEAIPPCALGAIASYASASYSCGLVDFQCQCSHSAAIQGGIAGDLATACTDLNGVLSAVGNICSCASANSGQSITLNAVQSACQPSAAAIPPCALGYIADAAKSIGGCAVYDFECQCSNSASVQAAIAGNVASVCTGSQGVNAVLSSVAGVCSCVSANAGGSGSSPASATGGSGSSGSSGSASAGSAGGSSVAKATGSAAGSAPAFSSFTGGAATPAAGGFLALLGGFAAML